MVLTRGARITGAVVCALLALIAASWIARDLNTADGPNQLWKFWESGSSGVGQIFLATTLYDLVLVVVYVAVAVAAVRSPLAAQALVAAAVITLAIRLPSLWVARAGWARPWSVDDLRDRALWSALAALVGALVLLIVAAAGRRGLAGEYDEDDRVPTRPSLGAGITAFIFLGVAGCAALAWEGWSADRVIGVSWSAYGHRFTGESGIYMPLLGVPVGWLNVALGVLGLVAAIAAVVRAHFSRPLGLVVALVLAGMGGLFLSVALRDKLLSRLGDLNTESQLIVLTQLFYLLAGVVVLLVLARRGVRDEPGIRQAPAWRQQPGFGPPPPSSPPPGW
ncbi:hypothetical protein [Streptomyces sp. NBC_01465]|uniref:hypothetical protein n=1 Tax=Streptomyces sp. NBC_01465 TaxID=2903878 RepID=UPI002E32CB7E|nr:hypothetical protein [Streptomyces sp. NBC_01465]